MRPLRVISKKTGEWHDFKSIQFAADFIGYSHSALKNALCVGYTPRSGLYDYIFIFKNDKDFDKKNKEAFDEIKKAQESKISV